MRIADNTEIRSITQQGRHSSSDDAEILQECTPSYSWLAKPPIPGSMSAIA
jgi:hypothetical protein